MKNEQNKKHKKGLLITLVTIQGGIHSYFGDYGIQKGDGVPKISVEEERKQVISNQLLFMSENR